ncbi:MAG: tRNA (guanosine(37)-N1)-methyltransferase TrmD [Deltaproteobacteria bacterium]|nr:tRNA (guanosine(37)-N1)-methyltransferase TrmD [Deltaproteobacteria bacterium]
MRFDVLTLFPAMFDPLMHVGVIGRAAAKRVFDIEVHNLRDWADPPHYVVDDAPYGGGGGMVMKPEPVWRALSAVRRQAPDSRVVLTTPQGKTFRQQDAVAFSRMAGVIFLCGRYEGVDERIRSWVDEEYSIGDYVLTGGEYAALVMVDAIARLVPGVLGNDASAEDDSFSEGLLEYPHYTRPVEFEGMTVPSVLVSGNHGEIARWRRQESLRRTFLRRPDLLAMQELDDADRRFVDDLRKGNA